MKFFVTTYMNHTSSYSDTQDVDNKIAFLSRMKELGILEHAYVKIQGGAIYIVNANSFAEVRTAFRESSISLNYKCEIREISKTANL